MRKFLVLFALSLMTISVYAETAPRILAVSSSEYLDIGLTETITISFNLPMNQALVEAGIQVEPQVPITFNWIDQQTLAIVPQDEWLEATVYTVTIDTSVATITDESLSEPYVFQFHTTGILNVLSVSPEPDNRRVITDEAQIAVAFDRPVVPLVTPSAQGDLLVPFSISPEIEGEGLWITTSLYVFTPRSSLRSGAEYIVTVPSGIETPDGSILQEDYVWSFRTLNPQTVSITASDKWDTYDTLLHSSFTVRFSQPMNHESTEAAISVTQYVSYGDESLVITGDFEWDESDTTVTFTPHELLALSSSVTVEVNSDALSADGFAALDIPVSENFYTVDAPAIRRSEPYNGGRVVPGMTTFDIYFNTRINNDTLENRYSIEPVPDGEITPYFGSDGLFSLRFETEANVRYSVTLEPGIEDIYGNAIETEFTSTFTARVNEQSDHLNFVGMPYRFSIAGTYLENPQVAIDAIGDFNATFRIYAVPVNQFPDDLVIYWDSYYGYNASLYDGYDPETGAYRIEPPAYAMPENIVHEWSVDFGDTPLDHITLTLPDGQPLPMGMYAVELDAPDIRRLDGFLLSVSNAGVTVKRGPGDTIIWVTDYETAQPIPDATVTAYRGDTVIPLGTTNDDGIVTLPEDEQYEVGTTYIVAEGEGVYGAWFGGGRANSLPATGSYIYTDRPIYRPGETVYFRGVMRNRDDMTYTVPDSLETIYVTVGSTDNYYYEDEDSADESLVTLEVPVTEFGTFSGEFVIPTDTELERMRLYASNCRVDAVDCNLTYSAAISFEVGHFRVPEYEVQVEAQQSEVIAGDPMNVLISANYYFGGAVSNASVDWEITNNTYGYGYFSYRGADHGFSFGVGGYHYSSVTAQPTTSMQTNNEGQYFISDAFEVDASTPQRIIVEGSVRDESGNTIIGSTPLLVHPANVYVGVRPSSRFSNIAEPVTIDLLTIFPDSTPHPDRTVDITITEIKWVNTAESFAVYQWERQETEISTLTMDTDSSGHGQFIFDAPEAGTYRIDASTLDDESRMTKTQTTIYVIDATQESGQTWFDSVYEYLTCGFEPEYHRLRLTTDQTSYFPGDIARIFIPNPFGAPATALITVERASVMQQAVAVIEGDALTYELLLTPDFAPSAYINVTLMAGIDEDNPNPRTLRGAIAVTIEPVNRRLNVELSASAAVVNPGDEVQFTVHVTDFEGNPVQGEVGIALTDEAVLALRPPNSDTLESSFYGQQRLSIHTYISARALLTVPGNTSAAGCGGGGGSNALDANIRDDFIYTPLWQPHLLTDENGEATVTITMPDNLTRWRLDARALTNDTLVGQTEINIISTLPLIVRPVAPRFFIIGDKAELGAVINNQTEVEQTVRVRLQISGATVASELIQTVTIAGGERARVVWLADIDSLEGVDFTVFADSGAYQDAAKPALTNVDGVIPVYRFVAQDTAATSGVFDVELARTEAISLPGRYSYMAGELTIQFDASLAEITLTSLEYLDTFAYENVEYTVSRFLPKVVTNRALAEFGIQDETLNTSLSESLNESLNLLQRVQNYDGGWGWYSGLHSNPYLTAYVVLGLVEAQESGYTIDVAMLQRAVEYVDTQLLQSVTFNTSDWQLNQQAFILYVLARSYADPESLRYHIDELFEQRVKMSLIGRAYLLMAYHIIDPQHSAIDALVDDLLGTAILSATGTHWEEEDLNYRIWDSDTRTTSVVLNALILTRPDHVLLPGAVRWLVTARHGDHWQSTQEIVWATVALNSWMSATGDLNTNYNYDVTFNDTVVLESAMQSPQDSARVTINVADMQANEINNLTINRSDGTGTLYYSATLDLLLPANEVPATSHGVLLDKQIFGIENNVDVVVNSASVGDVITVRISFTVSQDMYYFVLEDVLPAGLEVINPRLLTESRAGTSPRIESNRDDLFWSWAIWYFDRIELRDTGAVISAEYLPKGTYVFSYQVRAVTPGEFQSSPTHAYAMYQPEVYGRSSGSIFMITDTE